MPLLAPTDAGSSSLSFAGRRRETWACLLLGVLVGWFYLWTAFQPSSSWTISARNPEGYYPLETAGFRSGHLYAALEPHPALLALKDPYDPVANAPYRVHDMSLYRGHYYLYFGVTPVLVLFWPVAAITGQYLSEPFAVALFCSAAIWVGMALLLAVRRRHFPAAPFVALAAAWVCLAWATPLTLLVEGPQFYQVPIACAILLQVLMLGAIYLALHARHLALAWMSAAGFLFGLSIGARPNYLASFVVLFVPIIYLAWSKRAHPKGRIATLAKGIVCTFVPTVLCGLGLLAYNWARFGSVAEFGMHYQLAGERIMEMKVVSPQYLFRHMAYYLSNPGLWDSYFPFFSAHSGQPYGLFRYVPWTWLALPAFLRTRAQDPGERAGRSAFACAVALVFLSNLAFLSCFFGTTARYPGDFANAELVLAGVGALALGQRATGSGCRKLTRWALGATAGISLFFTMAVFVGWLPGPDRFLHLARAANWPAYAWQNARGNAYGGLRLELELPQHPIGPAEPILETGRQVDQRDWLEIDYLPDNRARLSFFHAGTGEFPSREVTIPADRRMVVEVRCGALLPPFGHPVFSGWSRAEYDNVKRDLRLTVNGSDVLRLSLDCYAASPADTTIGRFAWSTGGMQQTFGGTILSVARLSLEKPAKIEPLITKPEPVELTLFLPALNRLGADPILLTGKGAESDLLYCLYDGSNHIRFALDHYGGGGPVSESVSYDPLIAHAVTVWMGSMAGVSDPTRSMGAAADRLVVLFDGRTLLDVDQVFYPSSPDSAIVGYNAYGSSGAGHEFTGRVAGVRQVADSILPPAVRTGVYGAVEMSVDFPYGVIGTQEPLVVTGVTGSGDLVYVRYVDANHILVGFDHWGVGGIVGKPVEVDYGQTHRLTISFQALYPPGSALHSSDVVRVLLDGKPVLLGKFACHPSRADRIKIGKNPIGGSTCGPNFTGRILGVERPPEPRE